MNKPKNGTPKEPPAKHVARRDANGKFLPGASGNPAGRGHRLDFRSMFEAYLARAHPEQTTEFVFGEVIEDLRAGSHAGDVQASKELLNRIVGAVRQSIEVQTVAAVFISDQARESLHELISDPAIQAGMRAELRRRTN